MISQYITLDFTKRYLTPIYINQHEVDARDFIITCQSELSVPIDLTGATVVFYAKKPDATILFNACTIVDAEAGKIQYVPTEQTCAVDGALICQIVIVNGDADLRSMEFALTVNPGDDYGDAVESTSEFTALETALSDIGEVKADIATAEADIVALELQSATGWVPNSSTWEYASADVPTFVINITGDMTAVISPGFRFKLTQTTVKYFIVTAVGSYAGGITPITVYGGTDYTLTSDSISNTYYSGQKAPQGFPLSPTKWTIEFKSITDQAVAALDSNWKQAGNLQLSVPIGAWNTSLKGVANSVSAGTDVGTWVSLSTSATTESNSDFTAFTYNADSSNTKTHYGSIYVEHEIIVAAKTIFYVIMKRGVAAVSSVRMSGSLAPTVIKAVCAYL